MRRFVLIVNLATFPAVVMAQPVADPVITSLQEKLRDCFIDTFVARGDMTSEPKHAAAFLIEKCKPQGMALTAEILKKTPVISPDLPGFLAQRERDWAELMVVEMRRVIIQKMPAR